MGENAREGKREREMGRRRAAQAAAPFLDSTTKMSVSIFAFDGGRTRARTLDPLIKSQLLYQLSYAPIEIAGAGPRARPGM